MLSLVRLCVAPFFLLKHSSLLHYEYVILEKMKKIIVIQFRTSEKTLLEEEEAFRGKLNHIEVELIFKNAFLDELAWEKPETILEDAHAVVLGGSGDFDFDGGRDENDEKLKMSHALVQKMSPFLEYLEANDFPTLAVCFGHQIFGKFAGVAIVNDKAQAKVGSHKVSLTEEGKKDDLFKDLPTEFVAQYGHKDSLSMLPKNAILLANGDQCLHSALRFGRRRYSVQFHPELDIKDVLQKFASHPDYLPNGLTPEKLILESPYATQILINFVNNV